jgi:O-acetylhomoserine (thiol)-lyase
MKILYGKLVRLAREQQKDDLKKLEVNEQAAWGNQIRSYVLHPASTTHRQLSKADLEAIGIADNLIRLSVGIENVDDIIADLEGALSKI